MSKFLFQIIASCVIWGITASLLYMEFFVIIPEGNERLLDSSTGAFITMSVMAATFWFGTSKGSTDKNEMVYNSTPINPE